MKSTTPRALVLMVCVALGGMIFLAGCGSGTPASSPITPPPSPPPPPTPSLLVSGKVMAGAQPIAGASVQVYSAGTSGNGAGATALLASPVTTDASGAFTISSGLSCSSAAPMIYLVARGGQIGSAAVNAAITLATAVGDCSRLSTATTTSFTVNEVTTVAFTWALSQFLAAGGSVGASSTNAVGLANAFATAANLADSSTGKAPGSGFPATGKSPAAKVNALANLLNSCVVASGTSNACSTLFNTTTVAGSAAPSNTLDAALGLARNPGANVAALYTQAASSTAYSPALTAAPADWTLSIKFTGGGMGYPTGIGVDSQGNVWVASYSGVASEFSPVGSPAFASGITGYGLRTSYGLAIDGQNNVWIPNEDSPKTVNGGLGTVTVLNSSGQPISGANGFIAGGLNYPVAIAIDASGTAWVVDYGNSHITLLSSSGVPQSGTAGYTSPLFAFPVAVAIDANRTGWVGNQSGNAVTSMSSDGTKFANVACCNSPQGVAVDQRGYIWATNFYNDSVSQFSSSGTVVSAGYTGGGISHPQGIAIDGTGSVWVPSLRSASGAASATLAQLAGSNAAKPGTILSPAAGWLADAGLLVPYAVAIDASGNLWMTNFANYSTAPSGNEFYITEVIGMAAPVKTPVIGPPQAP